MKKSNREHTRIRKIEKRFRLSKAENDALKKWQNWLKLPCEADVFRMFIRSGVGYRFEYSHYGNVVAEVDRIGRNINQIAKVANARQSIHLSDVMQMREEVQNLEDLIMDYVINSAEVDKRIGEMFLEEE